MLELFKVLFFGGDLEPLFDPCPRCGKPFDCEAEIRHHQCP
jgi:hypothetical protein